MKGHQLMAWSVPEEYFGQRIQRFLVDRFNGEYSGKEIKRAIERNALEVNGVQERYASRRLTASDHIVFDLSVLSLEIPCRVSQFDELCILYEDEFLLIYNKPAGITSVEDGLLGILQSYKPTIESVHRLDKDTTGAIIFSKTDEAKNGLLEYFRNRLICKRYLTIVDGIVDKETGVIEKPIGRIYNKDGHTIWGIKPVKKGGNDATTKWSVIKRGERATLVECTLITGRTHQIRIHMSDMGYPVIGDIRYGFALKASSYQPQHQLLHAWNLCLNHPISGKELNIVAPLSDTFYQAINQLIGSVDL